MTISTERDAASTALFLRMTGEGRRAGIPPGPARAGSRYVHSSSFYRSQDGDLKWDQKLLRADELAAYVAAGAPRTRAAVDLEPLEAGQPTSIELPRLHLARVASLITVKPAATFFLSFAPATVFATAGGGTPTGVEVEELTGVFEKETATAGPFGVACGCPTEVLTDSTAATQAVDDLLDLSFSWALERDLLTGDGSTGPTVHRLNGILANGDIGTVAQGDVSGEYALDAIHRAVTAILANGFDDEPLAVLASPATMEVIRGQKGSDGRYVIEAAAAVVPEVTTWRSSNLIDDGTALVGAFRSGMTLWMQELSVASTQEYLDYFSRGLSRLQLRTRAWSRVVYPKAFCTVTDVATVS